MANVIGAYTSGQLQTTDSAPQTLPGRIIRLIKWAAFILAMMILAQVSGCASLSLPQFSSPFPTTTSSQIPQQPLDAATGQTLGTGPVRVALLLPLTGDVASVGQSMANSARLAMDFIAQSPNVNDNITLIIKDTAGNSARAAARASEAVSEGAKLILGPLKAQSVQAAGAVARSAGIPLIGFSNNSGAASPGIYLLNILPETEVKRSMAYARSQGKQALAAIVPDTEYGRIQEGAFQQAASELGMTIRAVYRFSNEQEARQNVAQITPFLQAGSIDALFLPDRATASSFGVLLEEAGVDKSNLTIIGSLDWTGDTAIQQTRFLAGAIFPAVDESGLAALRPAYEAKYASAPHALATISYTAVLLANSPSLSQSQPPYRQDQLIRNSGFNGRDGLFRFLSSGRSEYALVIKQVGIGGAVQLDGPKIL